MRPNITGIRRNSIKENSAGIAAVLVVFALGISGDVGVSLAQTEPTMGTETSTSDTSVVSQGQSRVIDKLSTEFSAFLGDDAEAVVTGLRNGTSITFTKTDPKPTLTDGSTTATDPDPTPTDPGLTSTGTPMAPTNSGSTQMGTPETVTINPPTGKMGFGNVRITLALARQQLGQLGIDQPTPEQLQAALLGGSITNGSGTAATTTELQGILTMRSEGMGWGQIAHKSGFKLGPVISGRQTIAEMAPLAESGEGSTDGQSGSTGGGMADGGAESVTKESGADNADSQSGSTEGEVVKVSSRSNAPKGDVVTGSGRSMGKPEKVIHGKVIRGSRGIVTGSGRSVGSSGGIRHSRGYSKGIVTGSGRPIGATSGITTGIGHGHGISRGGGLSKHSGGGGRGRGHHK